MSKAPNEQDLPESIQLSEVVVAAETARGRIAALCALAAVVANSAAIVVLNSARGDSVADNTLESLLQYDEHRGSFLAAYMLIATATLLTAPVLWYLAGAARARRPQTPGFATTIAIGGPVMLAVVLPVTTLIEASVIRDFIDTGVRTNAAAKEALRESGYEIATYARQAATIAVGFAWVMTTVSAMRAGLLTRFVGIIGIVIGVATVLLPAAATILQIFWMGSIAILLIGSPQRRPPAWREGRSIPWPGRGGTPAAIESTDDRSSTTDLAVTESE